MLTKEDLKEYGSVVRCEKHGSREFHVIINGFENNAIASFKLLGLINEKTNNEYPYVSRFTVDEEKFVLHLKKK